MKTKSGNKFVGRASVIAGVTVASVAVYLVWTGQNGEPGVAGAQVRLHRPASAPAAIAMPAQQVDPARELATTHAEAGTIVTAAINPSWLEKHGISAADLNADADGDGASNFQEMVAGTDPNPAGKARAANDAAPEAQFVDHTILTPSDAETRANLRRQAEEYYAGAEAARADLERRAAEIGAPLRTEDDAGNIGVLASVTDEGEPLYLQPHNIAAADTIGVDELWPSGAVTAVAGWPTGSTGLNLDGSDQTLTM